MGKKVDITARYFVEDYLSLQEQSSYASKSTSGGVSVTYSPLGGVTGNVSASSNRLDNNYKSVTEQAGIYAGSEGFDINVKGNADLKGAVIDSTATADKNSLMTGTLSVSDIANSSETKSSGIGLSYDGEKSNSSTSMLGDKGLIPNIPMATNESDSSITKSGIAEGSITITKPSEQKQDVSRINRNTEGTVNVLKNSFDPQKVQERQETAALFSEMAFNAIHELSHKRSGKQDGEICTWTTEERAMAHTLVGLISSEIAGSGNPMSTLTAAGVNALVVTALTRDAKAKEYFEKHPDQLQWASAVLGAAVAKTTGGSAQSGASIAANAVKNNYLRTEKYPERIEVVVWDIKALPHIGVRFIYDDAQNEELNFGNYTAKNMFPIGTGIIVDTNSTKYSDDSINKGEARITSAIYDPVKIKEIVDNANNVMKSAEEYKEPEAGNKIREDKKQEFGVIDAVYLRPSELSKYVIVKSDCLSFVQSIFGESLQDKKWSEFFTDRVNVFVNKNTDGIGEKQK